VQYMLMIVEPRGQRAARTEAEGRQLYETMLSYADELKARGVLVGAQSLQSDGDAVRVRVRDGKRTLVDGPFSEAKEMIGGYFLVECESRDQAIAIAAGIPAARWATVEVREAGACYQ
jgi:hypothetical protein